MADCRNCEFGGRPTYDWPCHICTDGSAFKQKQKPPTNADRIRAVSDEEIAAIICTGCPPGEKYYVCPTDFFGGDGCGDCWLDWLQSPAGGDGDG